MSDAGRFLEGAAPLLADEMKEQAERLAREANSALNGVSDALGLTPRVQEHPYGMLGAALGVGYVLGGGLFTPTTMRILTLGAKLASVPVVRDQLLDVAEAVVDGLLDQTKASPK
jgi:hypothetical protein